MRPSSGFGSPGYSAASTPRSSASERHSCRQRNTSPLTVLKASLRALGEVADHATCLPSRRASVMSVTPPYCCGLPGKTNGAPVALQMLP